MERALQVARERSAVAAGMAAAEPA